MRSDPLPILAMVAFSLLGLGCESERSIQRLPAAPSADTKPAPDEEWLPRLNPEGESFEQAVRAIASSRSQDMRRTAAQLLVGYGRGLSSPAWRATEEVVLREANRKSGLNPSGIQFEAQIDGRHDDLVVQVLLALDRLGEPAGEPYAFEVAENEYASLKVRRAALAVLSNHVDARDPVAKARVADAQRRIVAAEQRDPPGPLLSLGVNPKGAISNASKVIQGIVMDFMRQCHVGGVSGAVRIVAKVGPDGSVLSAEPSGVTGFSATTVDCLVHRVLATAWSPPEGGSATVILPIHVTSN